MCFVGHYRNKSNENNDKKTDVDVYDIIAIALKLGIRYQDLGLMSYTTLANITDAYLPKKKVPTQAQIDLIT